MPIARSDTVRTPPDTPVTIAVLANDIGSGLVITGVDQAAHGTVTITPTQRLLYAPEAGFQGVDSFAYTIRDAAGQSARGTVTVSVMPPNNPPVALDDTAVATAGTPLTIAVLANDGDPDGDPLTVVALESASHGSLSIAADQTVRYLPAAQYRGEDSFVYTIGDGRGGTARATVRVTVRAPNQPPVAHDGHVTTPAGTPLSIDLLAYASDPDGDPLRLTSLTLPLHGTLAVQNAQRVLYAPAAGFDGTDGFGYTVSDGQGTTATGRITVEVLRQNAPPVAANDNAATLAGQPVTIAVLANDGDPDGDPLSLVGVGLPEHGILAVNPDQTVTYTPAVGYVGADAFRYTVADGRGGEATATVTVTVSPSPPPPNLIDFDFESGPPSGLVLTAEGGSSADGAALTSALSPAGLDSWGARYFRAQATDGGRAYATWQPAIPRAAPFYLECGLRCILRPTFDSNGHYTNFVRIRFKGPVELADADALTLHLRIGRFQLGSGFDYRWSWALRKNAAQLNTASIASADLPVTNGADYGLWISFVGQTVGVWIDDVQLCDLTRSDWLAIDEIRLGANAHLGPVLKAGTLGFDNLRANVTNFPSLLAPPADTTPPSVPAGFIATAAGPSRIDLAWTAATDDIGVTGYEIWRNDAKIATTAGTSWSDAGLNPSTSYTYKVRARDAAGNLSAFSTTATATTPAAGDTTPPTVPTGLVGTAVSSSRIDLTWTASTDNVGVAGYEVFRGGTKIADVAATAYADTGLGPATAYGYQVRARDAAGNVSALTAAVVVTTQAVAAATSLRGATGIVITYNPVYGFGDRNQSFYGLRTISHLMTRMAYAPPGQMTTALRTDGTPWIYDHSTAGINAGGDKLGAYAENSYNQYGSRMVWIDIEQWNSKNVPNPLTDGTSYVEATDGYLANTDYVTARSGLRREVVRFRKAILDRARAYLAARGLGFVEFADYNLPRKLNVSERAILSTDSRITFEPANFSTYTDAIDATGPQCQYIVRQADYDRIVNGTGSGLTIEQCTEWFVNGVRTRMQAYAAAGKVLRPHVCVWPILFVAGGSTHGVIPPGTMTDLLNQLHALGVRRFGAFHWHGITSVWGNDAKRDAAHAVYGELAAWALAKGSEVQKIG